jgi:hypothetical protein
MFGGIFGTRKTTKSDVILAVAGAIIGVWKAVDTVKEFRADQEEEEQA